MEGHLHPGEVEAYFICTRPGKLSFATQAMNKKNRRAFLQTSAGALAASLSPAAVAALNAGVIPDYLATADTAQTAKPGASNEGRKPLRLGLIIGVGKDPDASMAKVHDLSLSTCQAFVDDFRPGVAERLRR